MNELTFLDLVILKKLGADSSVENFGSTINTSFFETANLLGTLKIKGYVNIESSLGGISKVIITDAGNGIMALADKKASEPIEPLDNALLHALAGGAKSPEALQSQLNIRSGDLSYHIHKMVSQGFMDYDVRSAKVSLMLTEQGFNSTGGVKVQGVPAVPAKMADEKKETEVKKEERKDAPKEKEDIMHILRGVEAEEKKHEHAEQRHAEHEHAHHGKKEHEHHEVPKPPLSPEEQKKQEKGKRFISKLEHYVAEYWIWVVLAIIAVAIFASAVYSMVSKMV